MYTQNYVLLSVNVLSHICRASITGVSHYRKAIIIYEIIILIPGQLL